MGLNALRNHKDEGLSVLSCSINGAPRMVTAGTPGSSSIFLFDFTMGIHGSKAGDSTLSSKTNKQFDKLKKELKKIMHPNPVSSRKLLFSMEKGKNF